MQRGRTVCVVTVLAALTAVGCVDRRFVVTSNVPGAQVTVDGDQLGPAPVDARYEYTGKREFRATSPGYDPLVQVVSFPPRWFDYPGLDLFAEVIWPFRIEDVRRVHLELQPAQPVAVDQIQAGAEALRSRGQTLPPPSVPNDQPPIARPTQDASGPGLFPPTGSTPIPPTVPGRVNTNR
jgi:PEGA domain